VSDIANPATTLTPRELSCSDAILAVLREAPRPLTTREVCLGAGPRLTEWDHRYAYHQPSSRPRVWALVECHAERGVDVVAESLEVDRWGYHLLVRWERLGIVRRGYDRSSPGRGPLWWSVAVVREWDGEVDVLDAIAGQWATP